jgi:hypothetical protein
MNQIFKTRQGGEGRLTTPPPELSIFPVLPAYPKPIKYFVRFFLFA